MRHYARIMFEVPFSCACYIDYSTKSTTAFTLCRNLLQMALIPPTNYGGVRNASKMNRPKGC
jgi:hypothetical protein